MNHTVRPIAARPFSARRICCSVAALVLGLAGLAAPAKAAEHLVRQVEIPESKAVYGRIESRFVVPARSRIGGTLVELDVSEGARVEAGQKLALVVDEKLALQLAAADARIRAVQSELANARSELERLQSLITRGATTQQRVDQVRTQVDVLGNQVNQAQSERAVVLQQASEGAVLAPATGRVLTVPARRGAVIMPGEVVATVAGGGVFLRLALPERHAPMLANGATVAVGAQGSDSLSASRSGRIEKIYPQIENGRVIVDVAVEGLPDAFAGERVLVRVPVATRPALLVPQAAIVTRAGIDLVRLAGRGAPREVAVILGEIVDTPQGRQREVLTGLRADDKVIVP